jgi:hypothetical protein
MFTIQPTVLLAAALGLATSGAYAATFGDLDTNDDDKLELSEFQEEFGVEQGIIYFNEYNGTGEAADDFVTSGKIAAYNSNLPAEGVSGPLLTESDFATADVNEDGVISKGEMLDHFGPEAQIALAKFDKNGDDTVTLDEVRSSDDPNGERGRGRLERSTETSNTRGNSGNRSEGNGQGSGRGRATR